MDRLSVLIAEDEPDLREYIAEVLSEKYRVLFAKDGEEALQAAQKHSPELILLDLNMPKLDGYSVCETLRESPQTKLTPIVVLSGSNTPDAMEKIKRLGADEFLSKPISPELLLEKVTEFIQIPGTKPSSNQDLIDSERVLVASGTKVDLRETEYKILKHLLSKEGEICKREDLARVIWPEDLSAESHRNLDPHISSLRKKLQKSRYVLRAVYGLGYKVLLRQY